jgi:hypothetical protein
LAQTPNILADKYGSIQYWKGRWANNRIKPDMLKKMIFERKTKDLDNSYGPILQLFHESTEKRRNLSLNTSE